MCIRDRDGSAQLAAGTKTLYDGVNTLNTGAGQLNDGAEMCIRDSVGTGLYYYGEETVFKITSCSVKGSIDGAVTPGTVAGRAEGSTIESCTADVTIDENAGTEDVYKRQAFGGYCHLDIMHCYDSI